ncbi:MAG: PfkB family carbohydrate kinase [Pseudomonadales bacterium]|nr:PfkB family carbohydrate kinase [Pseudomonadales bacterium]
MKTIILVTGSTAIDQTGIYDGSFEDYQANYAIKAFNVSFQLADMRTSFGGCAPNIAHGLTQLGIDAIPLSSAGRNFVDQYKAHLINLGINIDFIAVADDVANCASCMMINDVHGNQVIGFYPGPDNPRRQSPETLPFIDNIVLTILGPEEPELTLRQGRILFEHNVPLMVDPGQVISAFSKDQIRELLKLARYLVINHHEFEVLKTNGELTDEEVFSQVPEVVLTRGDKGVAIYSREGICHVDAVPDVKVDEVTGCGDAFRAGYAYGIVNNFSLTERGQAGCIMAARNLENPETQRYRITATELDVLRTTIYG